MSRTLALIAVLLMALSGCSLLQLQQSTREADLASYEALKAWLDKAHSVDAMSRKQVMTRLARFGRPDDPDELFYFGLLSQRTNDYRHWVQARDAFKEISQAPTVNNEQRQLAALLLRSNQGRINSYQKCQTVSADVATVQAELQQARSANDVLEQKIQAITDLETSISIRKEQ